MKIFIASLCLFVLIVSCTIVYYHWFNARTEFYQASLGSIYDQIDQEDYASASKSLHDLFGMFEKEDRILSLFIHHCEMHDTLSMMGRLKVYIAECERVDALSETNAIIQHIKNINKNEQPTLANIF